MKIAEINMLPNGSTGKIMFQIADLARDKGIEVKTFSPVIFSRQKLPSITLPPEHYIFGSVKENASHYYFGELLGRDGFFSQRGTKELICELNKFQPDIIHLHNLHNFTINMPILFEYIKKNNIQVVWTLHDCWSFTGHCPHFSMIGCDKWKTGCYKCPQPRIYPKMYIDTSKKMYKLKKELFSNIEKMILVTPSEWLANLVKQSFLKKYPIKVINNGIDINIFKPSDTNFRKTCDIASNQFMILGVAFDWGIRKGLDIFLRLASELDDRYQIVLVGTNNDIDKKLPDNIISIHRTNDQRELANIYSAADVFVNPTREDNFPTTNLESLASGTPVITFNTGGSPESINDKCGLVVECDDFNALKNAIIKTCEKCLFTEDDCRQRAQMFNMYDKFNEYIDLFVKLGS